MSASVDNGCDRSNWSAATYLKYHWSLFPTGYSEVINLACSGGRNKHLGPASAGGESLKGEPSQIERLSNVAAQHDIDPIVVGIGGNDMGFSTAVTACISAWVEKHWTWRDNTSCIDEIQNDHIPQLGTVWYKVTKSINLIKAQMAAVGDTDYKIVVALIEPNHSIALFKQRFVFGPTIHNITIKRDKTI